MTKILFIGLTESSHTTSWIDLLENSSFEFRLFALPTGAKPNSVNIPVYLSSQRFLKKPKYFPVKRISIFARIKSFMLFIKFKFYFYFPINYFKLPERLKTAIKKGKLKSGMKDLAIIPSLKSVIASFKPDIIHTLGIFNASALYQEISTQYPLIKWVMQIRGGPDLDYNYLQESGKIIINNVLTNADYIICDSKFNYSLATKLGAEASKFMLGVVSGAGGINLNLDKEINIKSDLRTIVWPKAHEGIASKALPVLEGIKLVWHELKNVVFKIYCLDQEEVQLWIQRNMPNESHSKFEIYGRVVREEFLSELSKSDIMLSPSIMDGIPNVLIESMANGVIPIVSPIETISEFVSDPENVHFARNLYPNEIARALINSLSDHSGNARKIQNNLALVKMNYDREVIRNKVTNFYREIEDASQ